MKLNKEPHPAERFDFVHLFGPRDAWMVGIEDAFGLTVDEAIAKSSVDHTDLAPDARLGAVPPA
jgi:hypothetical protein